MYLWSIRVCGWNAENETLAIAPTPVSFQGRKVNEASKSGTGSYPVR